MPGPIDFGPCEAVLTSPRVVCEERNRQVVFRNNNRVRIRKVTVDGCMITEGPRCDYLVMIDGQAVEFYIELKGSHVRRAIDQIETTIRQLSAGQNTLPKTCYIISSSFPKIHTLVQREKVRFLKQYKAKLVIKNNCIEHQV